MPRSPKNVAFITGATSGIGAVFARRFANQGYDLVMTGRRKEKIESLAEALSENCHVDARVILAELSDDNDLESLSAEIKATENLEVLVNNAGFAKSNPFHKEDYTVHEKMLRVHVLATMRLTHAALPSMIAKGKGTIINVSSLAGFTPFPQNAMYAATKAFIISLTESVHLELSGTGVRVQALCPGMTRKDFHERMGLDREKVYKDRGLWKAMSPEEVVEISLQYLEKNRIVCVPGSNNRFVSFLPRILPRSTLYKMAMSMAPRN